ncbi:MAG: hypothetical protein AAF391_04725 [Bacteroidota bacterium]
MKKIKAFGFLLVFGFALSSCQDDGVMQDLNVEDEASGKDTKAVGQALPNGPSTS